MSYLLIVKNKATVPFEKNRGLFGIHEAKDGHFEIELHAFLNASMLLDFQLHLKEY